MKTYWESLVLVLVLATTITTLASGCTNNSMQLPDGPSVTEAQNYVGEVSRIFSASSRVARYFTGQIISNWRNQGFDVQFEGNLIEYKTVRQTILDYVETLESNNALMHQNYGSIVYDPNMKYVELSSYTNTITKEIVAYEIRIFYGNFWDTYNTSYWYAKSVLFNSTFTENIQTHETLAL